MDLYIYNEDIELAGICDTYISLIWVQRYHSAGSFEVYAPYTEKNIDLLKPQRFIYRHDCDEGMYIATVEESIDSDNGKCIRASGYGIEGILRKRVIDKASVAIRILPTISHYLKKYSLVNLEISNTDTLDTIEVKTDSFVGETLETFMYGAMHTSGRDLSYRIVLDHDNRKLELMLYNGIDISSDVIFSDEFGNVNEMMYSYSEEGCSNVIICLCNPPESGVEYSVLPEYTLGEKSGLSRNERILFVDPVVSTGYRLVGEDIVEYRYLDVTKTLNDMRDAAASELQEFTENLSVKVVSGGYRTKWNVGDIVTVRNELRKTSYIKRIEEVEECFNMTGLSISPTFGEPLKTILDAIGGK